MTTRMAAGAVAERGRWLTPGLRTMRREERLGRNSRAAPPDSAEEASILVFVDQGKKRLNRPDLGLWPVFVPLEICPLPVHSPLTT